MDTEKLHQAFDQEKDNFVSFFHTALWRVCVDKIHHGKMAAFVSNYTSHGLQFGLAIANESGYIPLPAYFRDDIKYDQAQEILKRLNKIIFNLDAEMSDRIMISSMSGKPVEQETDKEEA